MASHKWRHNAAFLLLAALAPGLLLNPKQTEGNLYENRACGISFRYPDGWLTEEVPRGQSGRKGWLCGTRVAPKDLARRLKADKNVDLYSIEMEVVKRDFDGGATYGNFEHQGKGWIVVSQAIVPAEEISSPEWIGLKATLASRCYSEGDDGGYAGQCETFRAMLNNRSDVSAVIDAQPMSEYTFDLILNSFRFLGTKPGKRFAILEGFPYDFPGHGD